MPTMEQEGKMDYEFYHAVDKALTKIYQLVTTQGASGIEELQRRAPFLLHNPHPTQEEMQVLLLAAREDLDLRMADARGKWKYGKKWKSVLQEE